MGARRQTDNKRRRKERRGQTRQEWSSSLLPSSFVVCLLSCTQRRHFLSKALVYYCFRVFHHNGDISLDPFYLINSDLKSNVTPQLFSEGKTKSTDRRQMKKEAKKRTDKTSMVLYFASFFFCCLIIVLHPKKTFSVESTCVLLFLDFVTLVTST